MFSKKVILELGLLCPVASSAANNWLPLLPPVGALYYSDSQCVVHRPAPSELTGHLLQKQNVRSHSEFESLGVKLSNQCFGL